MKGIERDNDEIVFLYLDWVLLCQGIENLRSIYQKYFYFSIFQFDFSFFIKSILFNSRLLKSIVSVNFIKKCIQLESSQNTLDVYHLRILYEILVDVQQKDSSNFFIFFHLNFEFSKKIFYFFRCMVRIYQV